MPCKDCGDKITVARSNPYKKNIVLYPSDDLYIKIKGITDGDQPLDWSTGTLSFIVTDDGEEEFSYDNSNFDTEGSAGGLNDILILSKSRNSNEIQSLEKEHPYFFSLVFTRGGSSFTLWYAKFIVL